MGQNIGTGGRAWGKILGRCEVYTYRGVPDITYPEVKWNLVKFKPVLPTPESCPLYSCSQDPDFYENYADPDTGMTANKFAKRHPFGSRPGYVTTLGVVTVPKAPVGGYVYCPHAKRWLTLSSMGSARLLFHGGGFKVPAA